MLLQAENLSINFGNRQLLDDVNFYLDEGDKVVLSGFGVFSIVNTAERQGRNPRTGEAVRIASHRSVRFRSNMDIK